MNEECDVMWDNRGCESCVRDVMTSSEESVMTSSEESVMISVKRRE